MPDQALVISRDHELLAAIDAAAAAAEASVTVAAEVADIRRRWSQCSTVLVGTDMASLVIGMALSARTGIHVVGRDEEQLLNWSVPLAAPALLLPKQSGFLSSLLAASGQPEAKLGAVLRVLGGGSGAGATTFAAALAQSGAATNIKAALVEVDRYGGGVDLLFGAERSPGWRWSDLGAAAGYVGDLSGQLPNVSGVDLVSLANRQAISDLPEAEAVRAIVGALRRTHDLVVLDAGLAGPDAFAYSAKSLLVVAADVRAVLAARARVWDFSLHDADLVVRTGPGWRLAPEMVAESIGLPLAAVVTTDRQVQHDATVGAPPGRSRRSTLAKAVRPILEAALEGVQS